MEYVNGLFFYSIINLSDLHVNVAWMCDGRG